LRYSLIIPAYNESQRIVPTLNRVLSYVAEQGWDAELIIVNDGSRDDTADIIRGYALRNPMVRLIENPGNRGKGYSVRNGMLNARGEVLLFSDADLSSPIEEAPTLFQAIEAGADVAIGSRWLRSELQTERQPLHRQLFGRIFKTRNAASRRSHAKRHNPSSLCSELSGGDSTRRSFSSQRSKDSRSQKWQCDGRTTNAEGLILFATGFECFSTL
jgi:dolichyl-phosphate beta-glucosyltransferase